MRNRTLKIFISCALGAGIGALIALQLSHYFWWLGMLVGGFVGYISYEFEKVVAAVPSAWRYVVMNKPELGLPVDFLVMMRSLCSSLWVAAKGIFYSFLLILQWMLVTIIFGRHDYNGIIMGLSSVIIIFSILSVLAVLSSDINGLRTGSEKVECLRSGLIHFNVLSVPFYYLPYFLILGLWQGGKLFITITPTAISITSRFIKYLFTLIHSDARLLCGVDAAIGAAIGYFYGNAVVGAISGGVLGVINYELISKRVLGVVPRR